MNFLYISSLDTIDRYVVKIDQKFKQKKQDFGSAHMKQIKGTPNHRVKAKAKVG